MSICYSRRIITYICIFCILCADTCLFSDSSYCKIFWILLTVFNRKGAVYFWINRLRLSVIITYLFQAGGKTFYGENLSGTLRRNDQNTKLKPLIQALYHMKKIVAIHVIFSSQSLHLTSLGFFALAEHITAISDEIQFLVIACRR